MAKKILETKKSETSGTSPTFTLRLRPDFREFLEQVAKAEDRSIAWVLVQMAMETARKRGFKG